MATRHGPQVTLQNGATGTGNGSTLHLAELREATIQVTGTHSAQITWEATLDNSNWIAVALADLNSTTRARATTATTNGLYYLEESGGVQGIRARISAFTSGAVTVKGRGCS